MTRAGPDSWAFVTVRLFAPTTPRLHTLDVAQLRPITGPVVRWS
jgi:hypothetical protein